MNYKKIKEIRLKMLMTQEEFANALNVNVCTVQHWEQEKKQIIPSLRYQRRIKEFCEKNEICFKD